MEHVGATSHEELGPDPKLWAGMLASEAVRLKRLDDAIHQAGHLVQRFNDWASREREVIPYYQSYRLVCELPDNLDASRGARLIGADRHPPHCSEVCLQGDPVRPVARDLFERDTPSRGLHAASDDVNVLVGDVQVMQGAQENIAALVGLQAAHDVFRGVAGTPHLVLDLILKPWPAVCEGEIHLLGFDPTERYQVICEKVECAPEIVDCVAENEGNIERDCFTLAKQQPMLLGLIVDRDDDCTRITAKVFGDFSFKLGNVFASA